MYTYAAIKMICVLSISLPGPHNSMFLLTTSLLMRSWISFQHRTTTEFCPLPTYRVYLRDGAGYITIHEKRTLTNEFHEYKLRAYTQQRNNWTDQISDSSSWTAYRSAISLLTDYIRTSVIKISHGWITGGV
jgi:hypothetical protein